MRICANTLPQIAEYARSGRVVVFDTETTGCSRYDEICQIAAVEYVNGVQTRTFNTYICPSCEMNPWAEGVHGLSLEAHNNKFDMRMLNQECGKFDLCFAPDGIETCDTVALARHLRPGLDSYSLANLIEALSIDGINSHDAIDDTLACAGLFFKLLNSQECRISFPT